MNSSMPYLDPSRPIPDSFIPPNGATSVDVSVASLYGGKIEIHADKIDGQILGIVDIIGTGEGDIWKKITTPVNSIKEVHDLFFVFKGEKDLFNFDWWKFKK